MKGVLCILSLVVASFLVPVSGKTNPHLAKDEGVVRIRILEQKKPRAVRISAAESRLLIFDEESPRARLIVEPDDEITVRTEGTGVTILAEREVYLPEAKIVTANGTPLQLVIVGQSRSQVRTYGGALVLAPDQRRSGTLKIVNHIGLNDYVAAVLAREYGLDDVEGNKAMAVVIRTYTLRDSQKFGADYDHVDHVSSQVFEGLERISPEVRKAVQETEGEVLLHNGDLIEATYFSSSGGHTANNEDIWLSTPIPYLRGKMDPYDVSTSHSWTYSIPATRLLVLLSSRYGSGITDIKVKDYAADGRARRLILSRGNQKAVVVPAIEFRAFVTRNLGVSTIRSTLFSVSRSGSSFVFTGKGFGHGVGLNQHGAHEMARRGFDYREILSFYYTDTILGTFADTRAMSGLSTRVKKKDSIVDFVNTRSEESLETRMKRLPPSQ